MSKVWKLWDGIWMWLQQGSGLCSAVFKLGEKYYSMLPGDERMRRTSDVWGTGYSLQEGNRQRQKQIWKERCSEIFKIKFYLGIVEYKRLFNINELGQSTKRECSFSPSFYGWLPCNEPWEPKEIRPDHQVNLQSLLILLLSIKR